MITKIEVRPYRQNSNIWEADVKMLVQGQEVRRRWKSPMTSRTATERWAKEKALGYLAHVTGSGKTEEEETAKEPVPTFAEYAERWMRDYVIANQLKPTTRKTYEDILRAHLLPILGHLRLDAIDTAEVQRLKAERQHLGPVTVNKILARLSTMLRIAIEWHKPERPLIEKLPKIQRLKEPKVEKPHYTAEEQAKMLAAAEECEDPRAYVAFLLGDDAGLRHGEIIALRSWNVRFDDGPTGAILVTHTACNGILTTPKSNQVRRIPMSPRLRAALLKYLPTLESEWVVPNIHGEMCKCYHVISRLLRELQDEIGAKHGVHILRHTFATDALQHGATVREVQAMLGHALLATTEKYIHTAESQLDRAMLTVSERRMGAGDREDVRATRRLSGGARRGSGGARTRAETRRPRNGRRAGDDVAPRPNRRNSQPEGGK
ncbi:MAG TPA: site-specific integrase [Actinomycetota bacterium]|nr:site-specific integrase [Actinomycetota bacterium]